ncbi:MAG: YicC family protein [Planctomyces sp.]|nr:YicC family protein [Planctomyces sp.]MBA4119653.1 YicC family protein [Isosphaera sp.]
MIRSMTGFGDAATEAHGVRYFLEARSLNNRYFKATIRLPEEFQGLEAEIDAELRKRLARGSVTVVATCTESGEQAAHTINHAALSAYIAQLQRAPAVGGGAVRIELAPLLSLPGVLTPPGNGESRLERARAAFMSLLARACERLAQQRRREGDALRAELLSHSDEIDAHLAAVRARAPELVREYEARLRTRIETMLRQADVAAQPAEIIREVAVFAERSDISEEIQRLTEHLRHYRELLAATDERPVGRTLDFLAQEMLREANTMASKSADATVSRAIVEVKGAIDRIKEQVQNVE